MKKVLLVLSLLSLTGCATTEADKNMESVLVDKRNQEVKVYPDEVYMLPCGTFTILKDGTFKEVVTDRPIDAKTLQLCKQSKQVLIDWINRDKENYEANSKIK